MRGTFIGGAVLASKINLMIAQRLASDDLQDRIVNWADARAQDVKDTPPISRAIDGVEGASAGAMDIVSGAVIEYTYPELSQAVATGLREAQERSPDQGGPFSRAWIAVVDGTPWTADIADIPSDALVYVVNFAPYARRLEQGWNRARSLRHRPGLFITEAVSQVVQSAFPNVSVSREFVPLSGVAGTNWEVPYIRRRGEGRGEPILYPAISLLLRR